MKMPAFFIAIKRIVGAADRSPPEAPAKALAKINEIQRRFLIKRMFALRAQRARDKPPPLQNHTIF
jgi:hypothetical protein